MLSRKHNVPQPDQFICLNWPYLGLCILAGIRYLLKAKGRIKCEPGVGSFRVCGQEMRPMS